jgi:hypothetical protein
MKKPGDGIVRVIIHRVDHHRRDGHWFVATLHGCVVCHSKNPVVCSAVTLISEGLDPETVIAFEDAEIGDQEIITLAEALDFPVRGLGTVLPYPRRGVAS